MLSESEILAIFKGVEGIISDSHIVYASGKHGDTYINKDAVYPHTKYISELCLEIAKRFQERPVDIVAGPTIGGVILAQWTAHHLSQLQSREVLAVFAEPGDEGTRVFNRGYDKLVRGRNVLLVEDILTTGASIRKVVEAVCRLDGRIVGVGALVNRGKIDTHDIGGVDIMSLLNIDLTTHNADVCPLCQKDIPINVDVGKGRDYLMTKEN
jgi:orotate phosphoribosyltransferase